MKKLMILAVFLVFVSCKSAYKQTNIVHTDLKLDATGSVYVVVPEDGGFGNTIYRGSGQKTATELESAFSMYADSVESSLMSETPKEGISIGKEKGFKYIVLPTILHWEDRATEWSGQPDKIEIKVVIIEALTEKRLNVVSLFGRSPPMTLVGGVPDALLRNPIQRYVKSLYDD